MNHRLAALAAVLLGSLAANLVAPAAEPTTAPASTPAVPIISQGDLLARFAKKDAGLVVLDVRTPAEFAAGHVPGARNVPHDELAARLGELQDLRGKDVVLYCRSGRRSALAADVLRGAGFDKLLHLDGDFLAWQAENRPVEKPDAK